MGFPATSPSSPLGSGHAGSGRRGQGRTHNETPPALLAHCERYHDKSVTAGNRHNTSLGGTPRTPTGGPEPVGRQLANRSRLDPVRRNSAAQRTSGSASTGCGLWYERNRWLLRPEARTTRV